MLLGFSGHRDITVDPKWFHWLTRKVPDLRTWVHGGAKGFDTQVDEFCDAMNIEKNVVKPDYKNYPYKEAPLIRNRHIVSMSSMMVIAWDGRTSGGTFYTLNFTVKVGKPVFLIPVNRIMPEKAKKIVESQTAFAFE